MAFTTDNPLAAIGKPVGSNLNLAPAQDPRSIFPQADSLQHQFADQIRTDVQQGLPLPTSEQINQLRDQLFKTNDANGLPSLVNAFRSAGIDLSPLLHGLPNAELSTGAQPPAAPG